MPLLLLPYPAPVQSLTPSAVTAAWTVPAPTLLQQQILTPGVVAAAWTAPGATIAANGITHQPASVAAVWTVPTPTIASGLSMATATAVVAVWHVPDANTRTHKGVSAGGECQGGRGISTSVADCPERGIGTGSDCDARTVTAAGARWVVPAPTIGANVVTLAPEAIGGHPFELLWTVPPAVASTAEAPVCRCGTTFRDTFDVASAPTLISAHLPNRGTRWDNAQGGDGYFGREMEIDPSGQLTPQRELSSRSQPVPAPCAADCFAEVTMKWNEFGGGLGEIHLRAVDLNNCYALACHPLVGHLSLVKYVAGVESLLGQTSDVPTLGASKLYRLEISGSTLRAIVDGATVLTVTDTTFPDAGYAELYYHGGGDHNVAFSGYTHGNLPGGDCVDVTGLSGLQLLSGSPLLPIREADLSISGWALQYVDGAPECDAFRYDLDSAISVFAAGSSVLVATSSQDGGVLLLDPGSYDVLFHPLVPGYTVGTERDTWIRSVAVVAGYVTWATAWTLPATVVRAGYLEDGSSVACPCDGTPEILWEDVFTHAFTDVEPS